MKIVKAQLVLLLSIMSFCASAQRPMSYGELLPKVDSVKKEADRLYHIYNVSQYFSIKQETKRENAGIESFFHSNGDSIYNLFIDSSRQVVESYLFIYPAALPVDSFKVKRKLTVVISQNQNFAEAAFKMQ